MKALAQNTLIQNRYLIVHLIGKGGMGEVYLAVDQRLGSAVALKRTFFAGDEVLGNAFEREARILARMRHPVLPKVSDHFGEHDEQYLVMEHISGDDLSKRLESAQKPFPLSWVMFWADQLLDALSYLHSHEPPIIHRDIKPQNLKLTDENHIILLDFGLSKSSTGQTYISDTGSTGSVVGYTPHYAPMEQIRGIGTNPRSDIYSLSATLYQLMTNVVPADALSRADTMLNGMADSIEPPHQLNPEVPATVSEVILKGMEVSQERRFANAREMQKALRRAFAQMQEAMAAQTVAFNIGDGFPSEEPLSAAIENTKLMPSEPLHVATPDPPAAVNGEVDFDATLAFDPVENFGRVQQAGMAEAEMFTPADPDLRSGGNGISRPDENDEPAFVPPDLPIDDRSQDMQDSFVTVAASASAMRNAQPSVGADVASQAVPPRSVPRKSGSRAFAIVGGLAALLVLAAGVAGAGWYYYNNYYAAATVSEPSPSPSVVAEQSPSPAAEVVTDTNTATDSNSNAAIDSTTADSNSNNRQVDVSSETPPQNDGPPLPRQTPVVSRPPSTRPAGTPAARSTPKPRANPGRTDIVQ